MHCLHTQGGTQSTLSFEVFDKHIYIRHAAHSFRQNDMRSFLGIKYVIYSLCRTLAVVYFRYHIVFLLAGGVASGVLPQIRMIRILVPLGHPSAHLPLFRQTCCQRDCGIKMLLRLIPLNLLRQKQEGKRKHDLSISSYSTNSTVVFQIFPGDGIEASYLFGRQGIFLAGQNRNLIGHIRQRIGSRLQFPTLLQDIADLVTFHLHH